MRWIHRRRHPAPAPCHHGDRNFHFGGHFRPDLVPRDDFRAIRHNVLPPVRPENTLAAAADEHSALIGLALEPYAERGFEQPGAFLSKKHQIAAGLHTVD